MKKPKTFIIRVDSKEWEDAMLAHQKLFIPHDKRTEFAAEVLPAGTRIMLYRAWGPKKNQGIIAISTTKEDFDLSKDPGLN
jgi:hypothetical protein